jgi:hypothetical protein
MVMDMGNFNGQLTQEKIAESVQLIKFWRIAFEVLMSYLNLKINILWTTGVVPISETVVVVALWEKGSSKTQVNTKSAVFSIKNTSFSRRRI